MSNLWGIIWNLSESTGIGLGRFAPFVFERMIGRKGRKMSEARQILERLRDQLKGSVMELNIIKLKSADAGNYQAAADIEKQIMGDEFAIALINEELANLE